MNRRHFLSLHRKRLPDTGNGSVNKLSSPTPSLAPYAGTWSRRQRLHLLRRTLTAPTVAEVQATDGMTMDQLVNQLLTVPSQLPAPPTYTGEWLASSAISIETLFDLVDIVVDELRRWWTGQMVNSGMHIGERMTLFWHNHFATNRMKIPDPRWLYLQNQLFRQFAVGNFKDLAYRISVDKAMLLFLDGRANKVSPSNENYARELQELFTIGISDQGGNPNYTQQDIVAAAKVLTGWDWVGFGMDGDVVSNILTGHDLTNKTFYGQTINGKNDGAPELTRLLDLIFAKEETARYIIRKLYRFFVYTDSYLTPVTPIPDDIEQNIIGPLAATFRSSGWSIAAVLRILLKSEHFYDEQIIGSCIKSPIDLLTGMARSTRPSTVITGTELQDLAESLHLHAAVLGQTLFEPPGVQGWQFYRSWISTSTLPRRHSYSDEYLAGMTISYWTAVNAPVFNTKTYRTGNWNFDVLSFASQFNSYADDAVQLIKDITEHLFAYPASSKLMSTLTAQMEPTYEWAQASESVRRTRLNAMMKILMRAPNFQLM